MITRTPLLMIACTVGCARLGGGAQSDRPTSSLTVTPCDDPRRPDSLSTVHVIIQPADAATRGYQIELYSVSPTHRDSAVAIVGQATLPPVQGGLYRLRVRQIGHIPASDTFRIKSGDVLCATARLAWDPVILTPVP